MAASTLTRSTVDFDKPGSSVIPPAAMAHFVLYATDQNKMADFWQKFLGASVRYEKKNFLTLLSYDEEHHRIGIFSRPDKKPEDSRLAHVAFTFNTLDELLLAYRQRLALGIAPAWCTNHGPTMSFYYRDPEGTEIETQYDIFATAEEADRYIRTSAAFNSNPAGAPVDPEDIIRRVQAGEPVEQICVRSDEQQQ